jgi:guanylate kinase
MLEAEVVALKAQRQAFKEQLLGARAGGAAVATSIDEPSSQAGSPAPATSVAQAFAGVGAFCRAPPPKQQRPRRKNRHVSEGGGEGGGEGGDEGGGMEHPKRPGPSVPSVPSEEHRKRPVVVCGPSGVGKGTLIGRLLNDHPDQFGFSVSHTTRAPRPGEQHGVHYYFVEPAEMEAMIARGEFVEYARVHSHVYGTSHAGVRAVSDAGKTCVLDIDVQGATLVKKTSLDALFIFIAPPSMSELEKRLRGRSTETDEQISLRLGAAQKEMASLELSGFYDAVIINDDLEGAYARLKEVVLGAATARAHPAAPPAATAPATCWAPSPCWAPVPPAASPAAAATAAAPSQVLQRKHKHRHRKTPERVAVDDEERFIARMDLREAGEATLTKPPAPTPAPAQASAGSAGNAAALAAATGPAPQPKVAHTPEPPPPSPPPAAAAVARAKLYSSASTNWGPQMKVSAGEVEAINARIRSKSMAKGLVAKGLSPAAHHQNILRGAAATVEA